MSLFAGLKEKFADKLAEFTGSAIPSDPLDKHITELVEKATSDGLIAPDWTLNLAVVDFTNSNVYSHSALTLKALRRSFIKPNAKVQLLTIVLLETCVKNCAEEFHSQLAASELWGDIVRLAADSSVTQVDVDIRDKLLGLVEDFARALRQSRFQVDYASLLERGVDFPVRGTEDAVPILTPPRFHTSAVAAAGGGAAPAPALAAAGGGIPLPPDAGRMAPPEDPLAGVDEQDRAAIQAALAELEAEERAVQEAERVAAEAEAQERRQQHEEQQRRQQQHHHHAQLHAAHQHPHQPHYMPPQLMPETEDQAAAMLLAAAETAAAVAVPSGPPAAPGGVVEQQRAAAAPPQHPLGGRDGADVGNSNVEQQREDAVEQGGDNQTAEESTAALLEIASNSTLLLSEMLASVPDTEPLAVREPYVTEVADTCVRLRSRLERALGTLSDESLMAAALNQHEELSRVLLRYEELLAAAESLAPTRPRHAARFHTPARYSTGVAALQQPPPPPPSRSEQADPGQAVLAGQRVAQTAAVFAATLKEKMTGAFDKLMAAAAAARNPAQPGSTTPFLSDMNAITDAVPTGLGSGPSRVPADGAFTILDEDEDEDAHEGTSLLTKRTPLPVTQPTYQPPPPYTQALAQPTYEPSPPYQPQPSPTSYQLQQQQQPQRGTTVWPTPAAPTPPAAPAATAADLICFDDESAPSVASTPAVVPVADHAMSSPLHMWSHSAATVAQAPEPLTLAAAAAADDDLLSGLNIHTPPPAATAAPGPVPAPAAGMPHGGGGAAPSPGPGSRGLSNADTLVEALDRLVSQDSTGNSPVSGAGGQQAAPGGGAPMAEAHGAAGMP